MAIDTKNVSKEYLKSICNQNRISETNTIMSEEVKDLIISARQDLIFQGILPSKAVDEADGLIKRAVSTFVKANFGLDNKDYDALNNSYEMQRNTLSNSIEYSVKKETEGEVDVLA